MPNWKKVITSGSHAILNSIDVSETGSFLNGGVLITSSNGAEIYVDGNITASGDISASGLLHASLSFDSTPVTDGVVVYDTAGGQFYYTGSYGGGGGGGDRWTISEQDGSPSITPANTSYTTLQFENGQVGFNGSNVVINAPTLDQVTDQGNNTANSVFFLNGQTLNYAVQGGSGDATSGFRSSGGKAYTHVTPQPWTNKFALIGMPMNTSQANPGPAPYPNNYLVMGENFTTYTVVVDPGGGGPGGGGGGNPDDDHPSDLGGKMIVTGQGIQIQASSSVSSIELDNKARGIYMTPSALYFVNKDASASISGGLEPQSASAQIRFNTGSNSIEFLAGSTNETLKEVLFISKSGDNPRIGIGTDNPIRAFDFKEVRDDSRGGEILIRGSRTTKGADPGDEVGRINFAIDSSSFGKIDTSGSAAEIVSIVDSIDNTGVEGSLSLRVSPGKTLSPIQRIKLIGSPNSPAIEFTGSAEFDTDVTATDLTVSDFALLNSVRVGTTNFDPGDGVLHVEDYGVFVGGLKVGSSEDPGANNLIVDGTTTLEGITNIGNQTVDTLIVSASNVDFPSVVEKSSVLTTDNVLILEGDRVKQTPQSGLPYVKIADGVVPTDSTLLMFTGSNGTKEVNMANGITYSSISGWSFNGAGTISSLFADKFFAGSSTITNITSSGNISASGEVIASSGDFTSLTGSNLQILGTASIAYFETLYETSSIIYSSGSTKFGNTLDDTHQFTGSLDITGSITASGNVKAYNFIGQYGTDVLQGSSGVSDSIQFNNRAHWRKSNAYISSRGNEWVLSGNGIGEPNDYTEAYVHITKNSGGLKALSLDYSSNGNKATFDVDTNGFLEIHPEGLSTYFSGSITASGDISASGTIVGSNLSGTNTGDQDLSSYSTIVQLNASSSALQSNIDGKQATLTFGKSSGNALKSEEALTTNDVLLMGSSNVKGRTYSQFRSDINVEDGADVTDTANVQSSLLNQSLDLGSGEIETNTVSTVTTVIGSDSITNVDTFATSTYNGAIYDYILKDSTVGARAGQFMVAHDDGDVTFTDTSTKHLSDSTIPEITADINSGNVRVRVTNGNGYTFKSFVKKL